MPKDNKAFLADSLESPIVKNFDVAKSDSAELSETVRALYVGTAGDVRLKARDSAGPVTYKNVQAGQRLPVRATMVYATGTTADNIIGEV